jgi:hypothetical protein
MRPVRQFDDEGPTLEVIAYRDAHEIGREICDTPEEAARAVEQWSERQGVVRQVDDLSFHHDPRDIRDPSPDVFVDEDRRLEIDMS